ncbi:MAG: tetraacyldisaccharide 4'-kinase [Pseudomonadota bacterium]
MTLPLSAPGFWWSGTSWKARILAPFGLIYGAIAAGRMERPPQYRAKLPVICVGNFVAGGAGKTPVALALGTMLEAAAARPAFLSRGYGGSEAGPLQVDPDRHRAADVGDEPLLLAARAPTIIARDRVAGARLIEQTDATCIVMDDGFQNPSLQKTLSLAVVDGEVGIGNGMCLPAGPLRAPLSRQIRHADAVVAMGTGPGREAMQAVCREAGIDLFDARLELDVSGVQPGQRLLAFCGLGRPKKFFRALHEASLDVVHTVRFPDHHILSEAEAGAIDDRARADGLVPVTTQKDFMRLKSLTGPAQKALLETIRVIPATCRFADPDAVRNKLVTTVV